MQDALVILVGAGGGFENEIKDRIGGMVGTKKGPASQPRMPCSDSSTANVGVKGHPPNLPPHLVLWWELTAGRGWGPTGYHFVSLCVPYVPYRTVMECMYHVFRIEFDAGWVDLRHGNLT